MVAEFATVLATLIPAIYSAWQAKQGKGLNAAIGTAGKVAPIAGAGYALAKGAQEGSAGGPFTGTPGQIQNYDLFDKDQSAFLKQLLANIGNVGPDTGRGQGFGPIAEAEKNRFYSDTVPSLAERFTSLGTGGSQRSSAFQGALGQAGAGLSTELASLGSQFGQKQQALDQLQLNNLLGLALQPRTGNQYFTGQPGILHGLGGGLAQGLGQQIGRSLF